MMISQLKGVQQTIQGLIGERADRVAKLNKGLKLAGIMLYNWSQEEAPVDYGLMRASGFVRGNEFAGAITSVEVGYTSAYAPFVHEDMDAAHGSAFNAKHADELAKKPKTGPYRHDRGPNQKAKFLYGPAQEHREELAAVIKGEASA